MTPKFVFLDIDGTIVDLDGQMPESAARALEEAQSRGHQLILCTGRQRSQVYPWLLSRIPFDGMISCAGANVYVGEKRIFHATVPQERLARLIEYFRRENIGYGLQTEGAFVTEAWCEQKILDLFQSLGRSAEDIRVLFGGTTVDAHTEMRTDVEKAIYVRSGRSLETVRGEIGDYFTVLRYSFGEVDEENGEVTITGLNKTSGIQAYLEYHHADRADTIAIGDGENDMDMLEYAAVGVAMGNAAPHVKQCADVVTDHINQDGLAKAFAKLGLISPLD